MNYYFLMDDFNNTDRVYTLVDVEKQVRHNGKFEGSKYSFPRYLKDPMCPDTLYLNCQNQVKSLKFDYYKDGYGHLISDSLLPFFNKNRHTEMIAKKLIATRIKDGSVIRDDLNYVYFPATENLLDIAQSELEEGRNGYLIPHKLIFNEKVHQYDFFMINKTYLQQYIVLAEVCAKDFLTYNAKGARLIPQNEAFKQHCIDRRIDVQSLRKPKKPRLP